MYDKRHALIAAVGTASLVPSVAYACAGGGGHWLLWILVFPLILATFISLVSTVVVTTASAAVEGYRGVKLDTPRWWKSRLWLVGMTGFVVASVLMIAVTVALDLMGIYHLPFEPFYPLMTFMATAPLVSQTAYAARTWQTCDRRQRDDD